MQFSRYLKSALICVTFGVATTGVAKHHDNNPQAKPNVLLIITDEHNFRTLGAYRDLLPKEQAFEGEVRRIWAFGGDVYGSLATALYSLCGVGICRPPTRVSTRRSKFAVRVCADE